MSPNGDTLRLGIFNASVRLILLCQKLRQRGIFPHMCTKGLHPHYNICVLLLGHLPVSRDHGKKYPKKEIWPTMIWEEKGTHLIDPQFRSTGLHPALKKATSVSLESLLCLALLNKLLLKHSIKCLYEFFPSTKTRRPLTKSPTPVAWGKLLTLDRSSSNIGHRAV